MHANILGLLKTQNKNSSFVLPVNSIYVLRMHGIAEEVLNLHHLLRSLHLLKLDFFLFVKSNCT